MSSKQPHAIETEVSPVIGGRFRFSLDRQGEPITYEGEFLDIQRPNHLSLRWRIAGRGDDTQVNVTIEPRGAGAFLTLVHHLGAVSDHVAEEVRQDWHADFASLARLVN